MTETQKRISRLEKDVEDLHSQLLEISTKLKKLDESVQPRNIQPRVVGTLEDGVSRSLKNDS